MSLNKDILFQDVFEIAAWNVWEIWLKPHYKQLQTPWWKFNWVRFTKVAKKFKGLLEHYYNVFRKLDIFAISEDRLDIGCLHVFVYDNRIFQSTT